MALLVQQHMPAKNWLVLAMTAGPAMPAGPGVASASAQGAAAVARPRRILVVDDEPEMLTMTRLFLEQAFPGLQVDTAETGADALRLMDDAAYDAVVSDYRMPRMDGLEFLAQAATRVPADRRILMTAYADRTLQQRARQAGLRFIEKAGDPQNVVEAVGRALAF